MKSEVGLHPPDPRIPSWRDPAFGGKCLHVRGVLGYWGIGVWGCLWGESGSTFLWGSVFGRIREDNDRCFESRVLVQLNNKPKVEGVSGGCQGEKMRFSRGRQPWESTLRTLRLWWSRERSGRWSPCGSQRKPPWSRARCI